MKLAYITIFGRSDIHAWSGLGVYILSALENAGCQIQAIGDLEYQLDFIYKIKEVLYQRLLSKTYRMLWDPILLKSFSRQVERALAAIDCDMVFSIWTNPIAYLRTEKPVVFWGDATFAGLRDFYPRYSNLCAETIRGGNKAEQSALSKCRLAIYSSEWAANTAIQDYDVGPAKVKVVAFGANINSNRTIQDIEGIVKDKKSDVCRLLFVGVDWFRKGGGIAVEVAGQLNRRGIPTELHVVGCNPPGELPRYVKRHGFVSKTSHAGRQRLDDLFARAHFLILPSRADCTPVVFPEAASFGLPCLSTRVGGIPSVIRDGVNGQTFSVNAMPEAYCDYIESLWPSTQEYGQLALSSFHEYEARLNWGTAGQTVSALLRECCA
jgi:glycosyltransferase involved in cell wall biosynthesis